MTSISTEPLPTPLPAQPSSTKEAPRPPMWELAECTCPDFCERDHERD